MVATSRAISGDGVNPHPECVSLPGAVEENGQDCHRNSVPSRDVTGEAFGLNDAAILTSAVAGAASSAVFAGAATVCPAVAGMEFPAVGEDLSLAEVVPSAIPVSEPLRAVAEADPRSAVVMTSSTNLRGPDRAPGLDNSRNRTQDESRFDIVAVPELMVGPDAGEIADPPPAAQTVRSSGELSGLDSDLQPRQVDSMVISHEVCPEGQGLPQDSEEAIVIGAVGSAAPWFLTGWAEGVEVDFMIDTGC